MRLALALLLLAPLALRAQITIGPSDMPDAGDTVRYFSTVAAGLDPAPTEAGYIWDFSMLTPDQEAADTCVTVASSPLLYQFYFNNPFLYPEHQASYAVRGQGFSFQVLTVTNVFEYFKKDAAGFRNVGFGANVNSAPSSVRRTPVDWVHRFPMAYGDMDTSYSEFELTIPALFSFTQRQWRYNEVDGWGTLYLPADTFEVLRVKSVLQRNDSGYVEQFGQGFAFDEPETVEYKWIAQGMDEPVLVITTVSGQPTAARFHYSPEEIVTGLASPAHEALQVFPNPAEGEVTVLAPSARGGTVEVLDALGRTVRPLERVQPGARLTFATGGLAPGTYAVRFVSGGERTSVRLLLR